MSLGRKIRQICIYAATAYLTIFSAKNRAYSQVSAQAVMDVRVRIVSTSEVNTMIKTNIADQLEKPAENFPIGEFSVKFPKDMSYSITVDPVLKMKDDANSWNMDISLKQKMDNQDKHTFSFIGNPPASKITSGIYGGELVTRIEYL